MAESLARVYFRVKGYSIMAHRYRNQYGEIDLILKKERKLIAVEVKYRYDYKRAAESISLTQRHKITRALAYYLTTLSWNPTEIRFDAFLVSRTQIPIHLKNVWQEGEGGS